MDHIFIEYSFNFIRYNVIICLHECGHTQNVVGHTISFDRYQIDIQWVLIG